MKRYCHYLKSNKTGARPRSLLFFDCETKTLLKDQTGSVQDLRLFVACHYRHRSDNRKSRTVWTSGTTPEELSLFVLSHVHQKTCLNIFSANIWFDLRVSDLLTHLQTAGFGIKGWFTKGLVFYMKLIRGKESIKLINIQNIWKCNVKKIGEIIGLPKLDVDFNDVTDKDLLVYCRRDVEIIYLAMIKWFEFLKDNDLGSFGVTIAAQALNAFRHRFMTHRIAIHDNEKVLHLERTAYFGGRTECFYIGELKNTTTYALDINSQYPFVMASCEYPYQLKYYSEKVKIDSLYRLSDRYALVVNCDLDTSIPVYPKHIDGKTVFPVGKFNTSLCTGSYRHAFEQGHVVKIYGAALYIRGKIFATWVQKIYKLRRKFIKDGNFVYATQVKYLLNSLYGKFGQKMDDVIDEHDCKEKQYTKERIYYPDLDRWGLIVQVGNLYKEYIDSSKEGFNSFPAISAHVTDYARIYLWKLIQKAGKGNVFYVDTDSLYVNLDGYKNLKDYLHATELGSLKLEKQANYFKIQGLKDYTFGDVKVLKGIPKNATRISDDHYKCQQFPGIKGELTKGMKPKYTILNIEKHLKREYTKGQVLPSGVVIPFSLSEF